MNSQRGFDEKLNELLRLSLSPIQEVSLLLFHLPLKSPFETSFGSIDHREIIVCRIHAENITAFGECAADEDPLYSYETNFTAWEILKKYLFPLLRNCHTIGAYLNAVRSIRGHPMAKATLEGALWDLLAKERKTPLFRLWNGEKQKIPCGVSVGLQKDEEALLETIERHVKEGYRRIKIKIKPGRDRDLLALIRRSFPELPLMADANAAYTPDDTKLLQSFDDFHLMMLEQPLHYEDIYEHSLLQRHLTTPVCLDESILSTDIAHAAIQLGSCRIINIKTGRVGGHTESIRIHNVAQQNHVPVWCGGMLESGIGRAHNLALASLPNFTLPGDTSASNRYWHRDVIDPPVSIDSNGYAELPLKPGIGYEVDEDYLESLIIERYNLRL